ncbi:MAG: SRPBCC family protein [Saprospiraceae bacterium]|nr:SRPBCC family protein [Saprospiraceae bacterium]|tara:strand:- start:914 stop:1369 length:456 start_codon:yes stop_codon:yes gene_type:complete
MNRLFTEQYIPISLKEAWAFFSSPKNLKILTPDYMEFEITSSSYTEKMYPGQLIAYNVKPLLGIPLNWITEITHVIDNKYFVDEQRFGPYQLWHHEHHFTEQDTGVLMTDIVHYKLHWYKGGSVTNAWIVKGQLQKIFNYRNQKIKELFNS